MGREIWVVEANMDSTDLCELRVKTAGETLRTNAVRALLKAGGLPTKMKIANWIPIAMANSEEEANEKLTRLENMAIYERDHVASKGESLYFTSVG